MKLLSDRVKIELIQEQEVISKGGLVIPPNPNTGFRENFFRGKVIEVGEGRNIHGKIVPTTVKEGDMVMYPLSKYPLYNGEETGTYYHIVYETDILAILDKESE